MNITHTSIDDIYPTPWNRHEWTGSLISADGCPADDFDKFDVEEVLAHWSTEDDWDGDTAGLIRLRDGRFVGWESYWCPTGDGFFAARSGGTTDLIFGRSAEAVLSYIGEVARAELEVLMVSK